jgi:phenylacetate-CoA ligase
MTDAWMTVDAPVCESRIWEPAESLSRDELEALQLQRLREVVGRVAGVPFYREALAKAKVSVDHINSLDAVRRLPFTTKADLRDNYPLGFLAVPRSEVARYHGSSGTTGKPTFVAYTEEDRETWSNLCARFLSAGGLKPEHTVHVCFGYGMFTGAFGLHQGIEKVGAAVVPASAGNTPRQLMLVQDLDAEVLICTPSYAVNLADAAAQAGLDPRALPLKFGHFGGEPWTEEMRRRIECDLDILAFNNYGLSEIIGPGVSGECAWRCGMHLQEDHFLVECLDPQTLQPVGEGEPGELVITTLTKQAMPLLRYRTRDIASINRQPCACGRTTARMSRVVGRSDDMLIIKGVNVFPSQIEEALLRVEGAAPHYLIEIDRPGAMDEVSVKVEINADSFSDEMRQMQRLREMIDREIQSITGIRMHVELVKPQTLERAVGKAVRVLDHRRRKGLI